MFDVSRHWWLLSFGAVVALLGWTERRSEACDCIAPSRISPAAESTDVPTNAELFIGGNVPRPSNATLVGGGSTVELALQELRCGGYRYRTRLVLQPNTNYEVLQYDPPQVLTSFTTGGGPIEDEPAAVSIDTLWFGIDGAEEYTDCGGRAQIDFSVHAPGATTLMVHREPSLGGCEMIIFPEETSNFGSPYGDDCRVFTALTVGEEHCWEVRARDLAGNEGPLTRRCAEVLQCASADSAGDLTDCRSSSNVGCGVGRPESPPATAIFVGAVMSVLIMRRRRVVRAHGGGARKG